MTDISKLKKVEDLKGKLKEVITDEELIKIANEGLCPHYVLTNPVTDEKTIWFFPPEINSWFVDNYVRYNESKRGKLGMNYHFHYFDRNTHIANVEDIIPDELHRIKDLYKLPMESINTPSGIYFLCKGKKIVYIGQSTNIAGRICTHINDGLKDFDNVYFITCPISKLLQLESCLVRYFKPPLNESKNTQYIYNNISKADKRFAEKDSEILNFLLNEDVIVK